MGEPDALTVACRDNHIPLVDWYVRWQGPLPQMEALALGRFAGAADGRLAEALAIVASSSTACHEYLVAGLALGRHEEAVCRMLKDDRFGDVADSVVVRGCVACGGLLGCARLIAPDPHAWFHLVPSVLASGNLGFVRWVLQDATPPLPPVYGLHAVAADAPDVLEWLVRRGCDLPPATTARAARAGHVDTLAWLAEHSFTLGPDEVVAAAGANHVGVLEYLLSTGAALDERAAYAAARTNSLEAVQLLEERGCPMDPHLVALAACEAGAAAEVAGTGHDPHRVFLWWVGTGHRWPRLQCTRVASSRGAQRLAQVIQDAL